MDKRQNLEYERIKKAVRIGKVILPAVFVLYLGLFVVMQLYFPITAVKVLGYKLYQISYTKSMEPQFRYKDLIVVKDFDFDMIQKGDIITYLAPQSSGSGTMAITHKVDGVVDGTDGKRYIRTKGINLDLPDLVPVTRDGADNTHIYVGRYIFKSSFLGQVIGFLQTPMGFVSVCINIACITAVYQIFRRCSLAD